MTAAWQRRFDEALQRLTVLHEETRDQVKLIADGLVATTSRIDRIEVRLDRMDARLDRVDVRLDAIESRLDGIDVRLDGIDSRLDKIDGRLDSIDGRLDLIEPRLDHIAGDHDRRITLLERQRRTRH